MSPRRPTRNDTAGRIYLDLRASFRSDPLGSGRRDSGTSPCGLLCVKARKSMSFFALAQKTPVRGSTGGRLGRLATTSSSAHAPRCAPFSVLSTEHGPGAAMSRNGRGRSTSFPAHPQDPPAPGDPGTQHLVRPCRRGGSGRRGGGGRRVWRTPGARLSRPSARRRSGRRRDVARARERRC